MNAARALIATIALAAPVTLAAAPATAAVPTNDLPSGAVVVSDGFSETRDTTEATTDAYDTQVNENCAWRRTDASVWYSFTAVHDGPLRVDPSSSTYSAGVLVATGEPGNLSMVDYCSPGPILLQVTAGTTYSILVFDNQADGGGNGGTLNLSVFAPERASVDGMTIDPIGWVDAKTGVATLTGTITCTNAHSMDFFGQLSQRGPVEEPTDHGMILLFLDGPCDGTPQAWSVDVVPSEGTFTGGKASVITFSGACGDFLCVVGPTIEQTVKLRGGKQVAAASGQPS